MPDKKRGRVAEQIRQVMSEIIQFEVSDPRLAGVTVVDVEVDRELMYATVYVSALSGEETREEVMDGLVSATGYLRRELAGRMSLRRVPELRFKWDEAATYAARINDLIDSLDIPPAPDEEDTDNDSDLFD